MVNFLSSGRVICNQQQRLHGHNSRGAVSFGSRRKNRVSCTGLWVLGKETYWQGPAKWKSEGRIESYAVCKSQDRSFTCHQVVRIAYCPAKHQYLTLYISFRKGRKQNFFRQSWDNCGPIVRARLTRSFIVSPLKGPGKINHRLQDEATEEEKKFL